MWKSKSCPHCGEGDVLFAHDLTVRYEYCLQCGYRKDFGTTFTYEATAEEIAERRRKSKEANKLFWQNH
jgi:ribosomal protein S27AE